MCLSLSTLKGIEKVKQVENISDKWLRSGNLYMMEYSFEIIELLPIIRLALT